MIHVAQESIRNGAGNFGHGGQLPGGFRLFVGGAAPVSQAPSAIFQVVSLVEVGQGRRALGPSGVEIHVRAVKAGLGGQGEKLVRGQIAPSGCRA